VTAPTDPRHASTTDALPLAPSMEPALRSVALAHHGTGVPLRVVWIAALAMGVASIAAGAAFALGALIDVVTNLAFHQRLSAAPSSPLDHRLGALVLIVPVLGGVVVGLMARYGSRAIRGHGIPEAMEQVLTNESRVPLRMMFWKPISAAISIGTGGPFGAEGPIIATGGAVGSVLGQWIRTTADERKTLLAAGAAAGMAATFGTPVAAVLLAVELLLFEYRARSLVPVALATATATAIRHAVTGGAPAFGALAIATPDPLAVASCVALGAIAGLVAVAVTRLVYAIEDGFERLPIHWMWWPAIGGLAVGIVGIVEPRTLGVGYVNIEAALGGELAGGALATLAVWKLASWSISLGSGTSGGTLAPLLTIGGCLGGALAALTPGAVDPRLAALVGMAAMFASASRAFLASVLFAFETTQQPAALLPLLAGTAAGYLVACLATPNSIMTEKLARRGVRVAAGYAADLLDHVTVGEACTRAPITLAAGGTVADARAVLATAPHTQGFPVIDGERLRGVVTRRDLDAADPGTPLAGLLRRPPVTVHPDQSLRAAVDAMARAGVGRLAVVDRAAPERLLGILTRGDIVAVHGRGPARGS
jgi:CIC family chloride channel protein